MDKLHKFDSIYKFRYKNLDPIPKTRKKEIEEKDSKKKKDNIINKLGHKTKHTNRSRDDPECVFSIVSCDSHILFNFFIYILLYLYI